MTESKNHLENLYENWFLEYASYVILDRAVPYYEDGLKPVQRRILHTLHDMHDGRYHKVANVIGRTMAFHPHGDASIGDALVNLGQKDLLIDPQGNWGNPMTGDPAAAARYIEGRLTPFALEVLFNPETTHWVPSYDGRAQEPVTLPVKFPLLLAQGVEGIAVGLSTTILPHNFCELLEASIAILRKRTFELYPDFPTGGTMDVSQYNDGLRGGRVKVRAKIEKVDNRTLAIREIPFGTTTTSLIDSIVNASQKGRIKIKKVDDNTSREVEILIHLPNGADPQMTIDALYAFTDCEKSLSPNACVIVDQKPLFLGVRDILNRNTEQTVLLLEWELKNKLEHLQIKWHMTSLEKIFIEKEIYEVIKKAHDREEMIALIDQALKPFVKQLRRPVQREDILKLAEIPMRRISLFDKKKTEDLLLDLDQQIAETEGYLANLTDYAVSWFKGLLKKYGPGRERRTQIGEFSQVAAVHVAIANQKFYVNRKEGFIGTSLKKEEYLFDVSQYDELIVIRADGGCMITRVADKTFVGKNIILIEKFIRDNDRHIYNLIYQDGKTGPAYIKRFNIGGVTRDREYMLSKGTPGTKVLYLSSNLNGEAEVVEVVLKPRPRIKLNFEVDFSEIAVKGRSSVGNLVTKHPVRTVKKARAGVSTLGAKILYFDAPSGLVTIQKKGECLGEFEEGDRVFYVRTNGLARITEFSEPLLVGADVAYVGRLRSSEIKKRIFSAIYFEGGNYAYYVKRFTLDGAPTTMEFSLVTDHQDTRFIEFFPEADDQALIESQGVGRSINREVLDLSEVADVRGYKALGNKFTSKKIRKIARAPKEVKSGEQSPEEVLKNEKPLELDLFS